MEGYEVLMHNSNKYAYANLMQFLVDVLFLLLSFGIAYLVAGRLTTLQFTLMKYSLYKDDTDFKTAVAMMFRGRIEFLGDRARSFK